MGNLAFVDGLSQLFHPDVGARKTAGRVVEEHPRRVSLKNTSLESIKKSIFASIKGLREGDSHSSRVVLVLDGLDFVLAATSTDAEAMTDTLAELRKVRFLSLSLITTFMFIQNLTHDQKIACPLYYHNLRCRFTSDAVCQHPFRNQSCSFCRKYRTQSAFCRGAETARYRYSE